MNQVEQAILATVAYADIFQYPLSALEIHRYLIGVRATVEEVQATLEQSNLIASRLDVAEGFYALHGGIKNLAIRRQRDRFSARLWPRAARYGKVMAGLPFVRMVAVTGSLAVNNADKRADLDYLVVTQPGRLWTVRALVVGLVRLAGYSKETLCPNYFLSERALALQEQDLFTAHELAQMVPLSGMATYHRMRSLNPWVGEYLPNASMSEGPFLPSREKPSIIKPLGEVILRTTAVNRLEKWEMDRKVLKFTGHGISQPEAWFSIDRCKGHFNGHGQRILDAFSERIRDLQVVLA